MIGSRRIQHELERLHDFHVSLKTIHEVLKRNQAAPLRHPSRRKHPRQYKKKVPCEPVQMDTMKVAPGLFQYTVIDDCPLCSVMKLYPQLMAAHALKLIGYVVDEMLFPVERVQTHRGTVITAYSSGNAERLSHRVTT